MVRIDQKRRQNARNPRHFLSTADQDGSMRSGRLSLIGQFQSGRARSGNQHAL